MLPNRIKRQGELVSRRVQWLARTYGINNLVIIHLTTTRGMTWERLYQQFNNLWSKRLKGVYLDYLLVPEFGEKKGRLHGHVVAALRDDVRTGFDFSARDRAKKRGRVSAVGANDALRRELERWH